ncbi:hypothetical protein [Mesorhizobium xinjiangense]|uniref:hypothetical protein n=1 Tax=Mesorhizobium xinjiangense TaxID=2678685 RepID=UPI0012EDC48B|nr:hypothetical protein [Mesorhizobium xinjiangense]
MFASPSAIANPGNAAEPAAYRLPWYRRNTFNMSDAVLAGLGIGIAVAAATFPWYVFLNQDKFGVAALEFEGNEAASIISAAMTNTPRGFPPEDLTGLSLDYAATGSLPPRGQRPDAPAAAKQPFPGTPPNYALIHVANGRALIRDAKGLWIVERGSVLPDDSRVAAIETLNGAWVLRTNDNRVVEISQDAGALQVSVKR